MTDRSPSPLDRRREEFPTLEAGIHLLSHSLGPIPRGARRSMEAYLDRWRSHLGEDAWQAGWWELSREVGDAIALLIGGEAGSVQVQPNASVALYSALSCFDFTRGSKRRVVTTALDFHSMGYVWERQRARGVEVVVVPSEDGITIPMERILEAIDSSTALVALSHTSYRSSYRVDAKAIVERAHAHDASVLLDVYQSAGVLALDARGWGADFLIGGSIKWFCGGPSCGYLYVRPDRIPELEPSLTGWIAHAEPFAFSHDGLRYANEVRRFAQGTPCIPALYSALPGLRLLAEVGVDVLARESLRRGRRIVELAGERGWRLHCPAEAERRGGSVMIQVDDPQPLVRRLAERRVFLDCRPGVGLRLSTHFFNTDDEVEEALSILAELLPAG